VSQIKEVEPQAMDYTVQILFIYIILLLVRGCIVKDKTGKEREIGTIQFLVR
jgi:hypothetical protein